MIFYDGLGNIPNIPLTDLVSSVYIFISLQVNLVYYFPLNKNILIRHTFSLLVYWIFLKHNLCSGHILFYLNNPPLVHVIFMKSWTQACSCYPGLSINALQVIGVKSRTAWKKSSYSQCVNTGWENFIYTGRYYVIAGLTCPALIVNILFFSE